MPMPTIERFDMGRELERVAQAEKEKRKSPLDCFKVLEDDLRAFEATEDFPEAVRIRGLKVMATTLGNEFVATTYRHARMREMDEISNDEAKRESEESIANLNGNFNKLFEACQKNKLDDTWAKSFRSEDGATWDRKKVSDWAFSVYFYQREIFDAEEEKQNA